MQTQASHVQLIGIGNVDRQDDGVGQLVVRRLAELHPDWCVLQVRQLVPELVDCVADARILIFVDGAVDVAAGDVQVERIALDGSAFRRGVASHQFDPAMFLSLVQLIETSCNGESVGKNLRRYVWCVRIGIEQIGFGGAISARVMLGMERAVEQVGALVRVAEAA